MASLFVEALSELIGTCIFFLTIWGVGQGYAIAAGLFVAILIFGPVSGGHFNSAISLVKMITGEMAATQTGAYVIAQLIGGLLAVLISKNMLGKQ